MIEKSFPKGSSRRTVSAFMDLSLLQVQVNERGKRVKKGVEVIAFIRLECQSWSIITEVSSYRHRREKGKVRKLSCLSLAYLKFRKNRSWLHGRLDHFWCAKILSGCGWEKFTIDGACWVTWDGMRAVTKSTYWIWWRIVWKVESCDECARAMPSHAGVDLPTSPHQVISYNRSLQMVLGWRDRLLWRLGSVDLYGGVHVVLLVEAHWRAAHGRIDSAAHRRHTKEWRRLFRWRHLEYSKSRLSVKSKTRTDCSPPARCFRWARTWWDLSGCSLAWAWWSGWCRSLPATTFVGRCSCPGSAGLDAASWIVSAECHCRSEMSSG